ncbi:UPF0602 protein C4orf47 homolog isoform X2 [Coturnix japonica]|uniref:UPF0602 protein C4orf47 homolog isoform X2 n=1 Tax=Coturnix japonica TaxID=93934 RepID=UPI0013A5E45A|nr:UPF0602 protein C4orf47 homolog isoform X2 [Coturnix japonica]
MPAEGKTDMERIGLFSEMSYVSIGDNYVPRYMRPFNEAAGKNKQMLSEGSKTKSGLQDGYFEPEFKRIFSGEAYLDPVQLRRRYRLAESKKNLGKAFIPSNGDKLPYPNLTIGEQYVHEADGYEVEKILAKKALEEHRRLLKGGPFLTNIYPLEYFDINPYFNDKPLPPVKRPPLEKKIAVPFIPSSPAKKPGGMKGGTFDPYPSHSAEPYVAKKKTVILPSTEQKIFQPPPGPKSRPVTSIITQNVLRSLNTKNYKTACATSF